MEEERVYTIRLADAYRAPRTKRAKVAIRLIREFVSRHLKADVVRISPELNEKIWSRGIKKPPRKVKVKVKVTSEDEIRVAEVELAEGSEAS